MKKRLLVFLALIVATLGLFSLTGCGETKVDLTECLNYTIKGYDGYATITCSLNEEKLAEYVAEEKNIKNANSLTLMFKAYNDIVAIEEAVSIEPDKTENLSNGDTVTVTFNVDKDKAKNLSYKLSGKTKKIKVENLEQIKDVDVFEGMEYSFSGFDSAAYLRYSFNNNYGVSSYSFDVSKTSEICYGDDITFTLTESAQKTLLENGYRPTSTTKTIKADTVTRYLKSMDDYVSDVFEQDKKSFEKVIVEQITTTNTTNIEVTDLTYEGGYLMLNLDSSYYPKNRFLMVYSATLKSDEFTYNGELLNDKFYFTMPFDNLIIENGNKMEASTVSYTSMGGNVTFKNATGTLKRAYAIPESEKDTIKDRATKDVYGNNVTVQAVGNME